MTSNRVKRVLACLLAVVMVVMCWFPTYAKAVVLEGAALLTLDLFINVLIIAMLGSEMDGAFRGAAAADDMKPKDWLSMQINKYTNGQGLSEPGLLNMFQYGVKYWKDGTVVIDEQMTEWITDFQNWLWGNDAENSPNIRDYAESTVGETYYEYGDIKLSKINLGTAVNGGFFRSDVIADRSGVALYEGQYGIAANVNTYVYAGAVADSSGSIIVNYYVVDQGRYGYFTGKNDNYRYYVNTNLTRGGKLSIVSSGQGNVSYGVPINYTDVWPSSLDESQLVVHNENNPRGNPNKLSDAIAGVAAGAAAAGVAIGLPDSVLVGRDGESVPADATVDIADYVSAVADAAAGVYYPTMPVAIPGEGVTDVPVSIPADTTVPVDGVDDVGVDDVTGEAAGDVAGEASDDVTGTGDYTVALSDFFPFCIPFDLLAMLKKFQASAEAPKVDVPFNIQGNVTVFTVDLSPWDPVARVLRTMEKIAFAIGLAWATKNLIQGGS